MNRMNRLIATTFSALALHGLTAAAVQAADPAVKCESGKLKESAKYASCRLKAESKAVRLGLTPDFSKCELKFPSKFNLIEANAGLGVCPSEGDGASIDARITGDANDLAVLLAGGTLPDCNADLATCNGDLATCDTDLLTCDGYLTTCESDLAACETLPAAQPLKTGQTTCYNAAGTVIPCAGTGQDGELQMGVARSFTDNGDGTITDNATGLMWEKLSDDGSIHDADNTYTWTNAFATKVATLNSGSFAGYTDWRVPNRSELDSLVNLGAANPATYSAFNTGCVAACTVLTCSCTPMSDFWSSSTYHANPGVGWLLYFPDGGVFANVKTIPSRVRAVRAGS